MQPQPDVAAATGLRLPPVRCLSPTAEGAPVLNAAPQDPSPPCLPALQLSTAAEQSLFLLPGGAKDCSNEDNPLYILTGAALVLQLTRWPSTTVWLPCRNWDFPRPSQVHRNLCQAEFPNNKRQIKNHKNSKLNQHRGCFQSWTLAFLKRPRRGALSSCQVRRKQTLVQ